MCVFLFHFSVHWNRRHDLRDSIDNNCSNYRLCEINVIYFTRGGIKVAFQSELTRQFESVKGDGKLFTILFYSESSIERQCLYFFFVLRGKILRDLKRKCPVGLVPLRQSLLASNLSPKFYHGSMRISLGRWYWARKSTSAHMDGHVSETYLWVSSLSTCIFEPLQPRIV